MTDDLLHDLLDRAEAESSLCYRRETLLEIAALAAKAPGISYSYGKFVEEFRAQLASEANDDEVEVSAVHLRTFAQLALRKLEADAARRYG